MGNDGKTSLERNYTYDDCCYDMMSIFPRARSFNPESWKNGEVVKFPIV